MPPTISSIIRESGLSYATISERSGLSKARIGQMATGRRLHQMPPRSTVEGLARALDIPADDVADAIAESIRDSGGASRTLAHRITALPDRDRRIVVGLLDTLEGL